MRLWFLVMLLGTKAICLCKFSFPYLVDKSLARERFDTFFYKEENFSK